MVECKTDSGYGKEEEEIINMFMRAYRESTQTFIENCKDPALKQKLQNQLKLSWKEI